MQWFVVSGQQLKLGSNPSTINKASLLELESTKQGLLLPRISDTTVATLATAPDGMLVYFTVDSTLLIRKGGHWQMIADLANFWRLGVAAGGDSLSRLQDVALSAPANGQLLQYNGSKWVNLTPAYLSTIDTTNIANFYVKVRSELSAGTGATYNAATGVITAAGVSNLSNSLSGYNVTVNSSSGTGTTFALPKDSLSRLQDVTLSAPASGQLLQYNGTKWVNLTPS